MEFRTLRLDEIETWLGHCAGVFAPVERDYFAAHFQNDPWRNHEDILVATDGERIMSSLRIFQRSLRIRGEIISMGGIGEVATAPEGRGSGLASTLLKQAIGIMESRGTAISMLFGHHSNYHRLGWLPIPLPQKRSAIKFCPANPTWRFGRPDLPADLPAMAELHQQYNATANGVVVRNDFRYWQQWVSSEAAPCRVARGNNGEICAYLYAKQRNDELLIRDFAATPEAENAFGSMVCDLLPDLNTPAKPTSVLYPAFIKADLPVKEQCQDEALMFRLITPFKRGKLTINTSADLSPLLLENGAASGGYVFWYLDAF